MALISLVVTQALSKEEAMSLASDLDRYPSLTASQQEPITFALFARLTAIQAEQEQLHTRATALLTEVDSYRSFVIANYPAGSAERADAVTILAQLQQAVATYANAVDNVTAAYTGL